MRTRTASGATPSGSSAGATRSRSSSAARVLNVMAAIVAGSTPVATSQATRATRVVVLPLPAGAMHRTGPGGAVAAARWSGASRASRSATAGGRAATGSAAVRRGCASAPVGGRAGDEGRLSSIPTLTGAASRELTRNSPARCETIGTFGRGSARAPALRSRCAPRAIRREGAGRSRLHAMPSRRTSAHASCASCRRRCPSADLPTNHGPVDRRRAAPGAAARGSSRRGLAARQADRHRWRRLLRRRRHAAGPDGEVRRPGRHAHVCQADGDRRQGRQRHGPGVPAEHRCRLVHAGDGRLSRRARLDQQHVLPDR